MAAPGRSPSAELSPWGLRLGLLTGQKARWTAAQVGSRREDGSARMEPVCPVGEQDRQTAGQAKSPSPVFFYTCLGIFQSLVRSTRN